MLISHVELLYAPKHLDNVEINFSLQYLHIYIQIDQGIIVKFTCNWYRFEVQQIQDYSSICTLHYHKFIVKKIHYWLYRSKFQLAKQIYKENPVTTVVYYASNEIIMCCITNQ